jgi:homoserine dehydrogenase
MYKGWDETPVKAASLSDSEYRFFVRCSSGDAEAVKAEFSGVTESVSEGSETGFITGKMTQSEFDAAASKAGIRILGSIRVYE